MACDEHTSKHLSCCLFVQARELGLPVTRQTQLEAACQEIAEHMQPDIEVNSVRAGASDAAAAADSTAGQSAEEVGSTLSMGPEPHTAVSDQPSVSGSTRPHRSNSSKQNNRHTKAPQQKQVPGCASGADNSMRAGLDSEVLLHACRAQRETAPQQQQQQGPAAGSASGADSNSGHTQLGLPGCDLVEWGVARYVLHEYAEAVAVDGNGQVLHDPDPQLPVLPLAAATSEQLGWEEGGPCGVLQGHASPVDRLQL